RQKGKRLSRPETRIAEIPVPLRSGACLVGPIKGRQSEHRRRRGCWRLVGEDEAARLLHRGYPARVSHFFGPDEGYSIARTTAEGAEQMRIVTVGRGNVGGGLADLWERAGHQVTRIGRDGGD